jgi:hypothetical protein
VPISDYGPYGGRKVWRAISAAVRERAAHRCQWCGVANYSLTPKGAKIVLTVARLNHDRGDNDPDNLTVLCQRCHLGYDQALHQTNAARTRQRRRQAAHLGAETTSAQRR